MTANNVTHKILIKQLQQGNERAFTHLYDLYSKQLYRNILRLVKDEASAEELLQDLFLKIWEKRADIDPGKSFKSFLYKIAENLVYTHFRRLAKESRLTAKLTRSYDDHDTNAEDALITKESQRLLHQAIATLSPQRKRIYVLCKLEGKSYEEASQELGLSTATIRNQIVKANKTLRNYLYNNQELTVLLLTADILRHLK